MPQLALRALRAPGPPVDANLEIRTLLANGLITEAFELQRSKCDEELLLEFFKGCHELKRWSQVMGLVLTEREGEVLTKYLETSGSLLSENLQLLYLLQRNKYIEAINYLGCLDHKRRPRGLHQKCESTQDLIFASYKLGMVPSEKELTDIYLSIRNRLPQQETEEVSNPVPLSTVLNKQLLGNELNVVGGIFHRAVLNAKAASRNDNQPTFGVDINKNYVPFLSKPQIDFDYFENNNHNPITHAKPYVASGKRRKETGYEGKDDAESKQPAAKRQRTDSFAITDRSLRKTMGVNAALLTPFRSTNLKQSETLSSPPSPIHKTSLNESVNLLSTPVVKNTRIEKRLSSRGDRAQTPQSILKNRHTDHGSITSRRSPSPTFTAGSARRSVDFDERSFRFNAPNRSMDSDSDYRLTAIPETNADDDDSEQEHIKTSYPSIQPRPGIHTADTSFASTADEFYSPDTSKTYDKPICKTFEEMESETEEGQEISRISVNAEREDELSVQKVRSSPPRQRSRSATPETTTTTPRMMTRARSKQQLNETPDHIEEELKQKNKPETSTPLQSIKGRTSLRAYKTLTKPLSKTVIESNAMKNFIERNKASKTALNIEEQPSEIYYPESKDLTDSSNVSHMQMGRKNVLEDNSYVSESFAKRFTREVNSTVYSDNSSLGVSNPQTRRNVLQDSSSMDAGRWEKEGYRTGDNSEAAEQNKLVEEPDEEMPEIDANEAGVERNTEIMESEDEAQPDERMEQQQPHADIIETLKETKETSPETNVEAANASTSSSGEVEDAAQTSELSDEIERRAILTDSSTVSDSLMKKYTKFINDTGASEHSTMFTSHAKNVLEDSSFGPQITITTEEINVEIEENITEGQTTSTKIDIKIREQTEEKNVEQIDKNADTERQEVK